MQIFFKDVDKRIRWRNRLILLFLASIVYFSGINGIRFIESDEGWYAEFTKEMIRSGNWLVPKYLNEIWLTKPPLHFWLALPAVKVFGIGEWQFRIVDVIFMIINILLIEELGTRLFNQRVGLWAGMIFLTSPLAIYFGSQFTPDPLLWLCLLVSVLSLWEISQGITTVACPIILWTFIGIGILLKGPAIIFYVSIFCFALFFRGSCKTPMLTDVRLFFLWSVLSLLIALPWYIYIGVFHPNEFINGFIKKEFLTRISGGDPFNNTAYPGYYALLSLLGFFPWITFIPGTIYAAIKQLKDEKIRTLLVWGTFTWILLEIMPSKLNNYIIPCYIPFSLLLAWKLDSYLLSRKSIACFYAIVSGMIIFFTSIKIFYIPNLEMVNLSYRVAERVNLHQYTAENVYLAGYAKPGLVAYISSEKTPIVLKPSEVQSLFASKKSFVIVMTQNFFDHLPKEAQLQLVQNNSWKNPIEGYNYDNLRRDKIWVAFFH